MVLLYDTYMTLMRHLLEQIIVSTVTVFYMWYIIRVSAKICGAERVIVIQ